MHLQNLLCVSDIYTIQEGKAIENAHQRQDMTVKFHDKSLFQLWLLEQGTSTFQMVMILDSGFFIVVGTMTKRRSIIYIIFDHIVVKERIQVEKEQIGSKERKIK